MGLKLSPLVRDILAEHNPLIQELRARRKRKQKTGRPKEAKAPAQVTPPEPANPERDILYFLALGRIGECDDHEQP